MEAFRAVWFGDLPGYRHGRHGNSRSHQKGHMNVYYIEKRKRRTMLPKPYSQGLKRRRIRMPKKSHALCIYNRTTCVCTHMHMEICTRVLLLWVVLHHTYNSTVGRKGFKAVGKLEKQKPCSAPVGLCGTWAKAAGPSLRTPGNLAKVRSGPQFGQASLESSLGLSYSK